MSELTPVNPLAILEEETFAAIPRDENGALVLENIAQANWCLARIARDEKALKAAQDAIAAEKERWDAWLNAKKLEVEHRRGFFLAPLRDWLKRVLAGGKKKSESLPAGTIGFRSQQPTIIRDDAALVEWLTVNQLESEFVSVEVVKTPKWEELKKHLSFKENGAAVFTRAEAFDPTGEVLECVQVTHRDDKLYWKTYSGMDALTMKDEE